MEKKCDQIWKVRDWSKKQAEASRQIELTEKAECEAAMVKLVDEHKKVMKRITVKYYQ